MTGKMSDYGTPGLALYHMCQKHAELAKRIRDGEVGSYWHCDGCGGTKDDYMLTDERWAEAHPEGRKGHLCLSCVSARLGRPLVASDFSDAIVNLPIALGMVMGYQMSATEATCDS